MKNFQLVIKLAVDGEPIEAWVDILIPATSMEDVPAEALAKRYLEPTGVLLVGVIKQHCKGREPKGDQ